MTKALEMKAQAIDEVIDREGGYVNHPKDKGGPTKYGITEAKAREHGYQGHIADLTRAFAVRVYEADFWGRLRLDEVSQYSPELAVYLFDFGVNSGTGRAAKFLQRLLNSLNHCGEHYPDIRVDGAVGRMTLQSLKGFYAKRGESGMNVLAHAVNGLRIAFCVGITEDNESQEVFAFGWLSRIVNL